MRLASRLVVAAGLVAMATAAHADDWNGFYVGLNAGLSFNDFASHTTTVNPPVAYFAPSSVVAINGASGLSTKTTGIAAGLTGGYNMQFGDLVVGLDGDIDVTSGNGSTSVTEPYPCCTTTSFTVSTTTKLNWGLTARPRVGWLMGDVLFYGTGGLAAEDLKYQELFSDTFSGATESASSNGLRIGWVVGAGLEVPIGPGWTLKGEYLHTDLGTLSVSSSNFSGGAAQVFTSTDHIRMDTLKLGLNWHV